MKLRIISESLSSEELRIAISEIKDFLGLLTISARLDKSFYVYGTFEYEIQTTDNTTHIKIKRESERGN